jgi:hypothetical protein
VKVLVLAACVALTACTGSIYRYNIQHARISPEAKLSPSEIEQVIRTVTNKSLRLIVGVTRYHHTGEVVVYTDDADEGLMVYYLRKSADGSWRITHYERGSLMAL